MGLGCAACRDDENPFIIKHDYFLANKEAKKWVALDCTSDKKEYEKQRIPGALYLEMTAEIKKAPKKWPTAEQMKPILKDLGIGKETPVVCYDQADGIFACRAAVLLHGLGCKDVHVLGCKFGEHYPASTKKLDESPKATGQDFDFV